MRKWIEKIALVLATTAVTLVLLELALLAVYPAHEAWKLKSLPDPEFGWVLKPGADYRRQVPGALVHVNYNAQGFRDIDGDAPVPQGALRVVVLGDSFMEANMVPPEQVFHKQFERLAERDGRTARSWNLGVRGYGTLQEYMAYEKAGAARMPDLVLLAFYLHNDVRNNAEHLNAGAKSGRGGNRKRPFLDEAAQEWRILPPDFETIRADIEKLNNSFWLRVRHSSVLLTLIRQASDWFKPDALVSRGSATLSMHMCDGGKAYNKAWRTTERILARLKRDVESRGGQLAVFSVPAIFDVDTSAVRDIAGPDAANEYEACVENSPGYARLQSVLESNGIAYIDTRPAFREAIEGKGQNLFVKGDWHWNGAGHETAARVVYDTLKARNLIPER